MAEVCEATGIVIYPKMVGSTNVPEIIAGFQGMGFPNCTGVIDGTHVPIICPLQGVYEYINHKYYTTVMQALGGHGGRFRVALGGCMMPGCSEDQDFTFMEKLGCYSHRMTSL